MFTRCAVPLDDDDIWVNERIVNTILEKGYYGIIVVNISALARLHLEHAPVLSTSRL